LQNRFIICYDVSDDQRRTAVFNTLRGFGDHLQYSVFGCDLSAKERAELAARLELLVDHSTDQVLIIDLGPVDGRGASCVQAIGIPYRASRRRTVIF
jgi:CRISPR-associated protein Cas2